MKELIRRLRWIGKDEPSTFKAETANQAANTLEKLQAENEELFYTLEGVMHSVDKWLDDGDYSPNRVQRAATMREKTLQIVEQLQVALEQTKRERDAAVADIPKRCCFCKHERHMYHVDGRVDGVCKTCVENGRCNWTWRGPQDKREGMG